jgi:hypothetical protein
VKVLKTLNYVLDDGHEMIPNSIKLTLNSSHRIHCGYRNGTLKTWELKSKRTKKGNVTKYTELDSYTLGSMPVDLINSHNENVIIAKSDGYPFALLYKEKLQLLPIEYIPKFQRIIYFRQGAYFGITNDGVEIMKIYEDGFGNVTHKNRIEKINYQRREDDSMVVDQGNVKTILHPYRDDSIFVKKYEMDDFFPFKLIYDRPSNTVIFLCNTNIPDIQKLVLYNPETQTIYQTKAFHPGDTIVSVSVWEPKSRYICVALNHKGRRSEGGGVGSLYFFRIKKIDDYLGSVTFKDPITALCTSSKTYCLVGSGSKMHQIKLLKGNGAKKSVIPEAAANISIYDTAVSIWTSDELIYVAVRKLFICVFVFDSVRKEFIFIKDSGGRGRLQNINDICVSKNSQFDIAVSKQLHQPENDIAIFSLQNTNMIECFLDDSVFENLKLQSNFKFNLHEPCLKLGMGSLDLQLGSCQKEVFWNDHSNRKDHLFATSVYGTLFIFSRLSKAAFDYFMVIQNVMEGFRETCPIFGNSLRDYRGEESGNVIDGSFLIQYLSLGADKKLEIVDCCNKIGEENYDVMELELVLARSQ